MIIDLRIHTIPGRSTSDFHQAGGHCLHQARSAVRCSASARGGGGWGSGLAYDNSVALRFFGVFSYRRADAFVLLLAR